MVRLSMSYYRNGSKVEYTPTGHKATVIRVLPNDEYTIEFDDPNLIPPTMDVKEHTLLPQLAPFDMFGNMMPEPAPRKETHCPKCGRPWKRTVGFTSTFYDCFHCNLKREDA